MNRLNKKFYIISLCVIILLGIIVGILLFTKHNPQSNDNYNYQGKTSKTFTVNDLTKREKDIAGVDLDANLEDKKLYTDEYKKYIEAPDEKKKESDVIPAKYEVPYEVIDEIKDDLNKKEVVIDYNNYELDPETGLPVQFNLKDVIDIKVENQGSYGLCWDFASMKSLETYCALNNLGNFDFSEIHLDYLESNLLYGTREIHDGGNFQMFEKYIGEFGVVDESQAPYREHSKEEYYKFMDMPKTMEVTETIDFPYMYYDYDLSEEENQAKEKEFRKTVKEHILKNGGLYAAINATDGINLYLPPEDEEIWWPNHAITIVGWDDNYSKDSFTNWNNGHTPKNNGAYIALNSWGPNSNDNGYFYISYEDKFVEKYMSGIVSTSLNDAVKVSSIHNSTIRKYITDRFGHLLLDSNGEKYVTKAILRSVTELDLSGTGMTSLNGIDIFENLYYLDVSDNSISDLSPLAGMKKLGHIEVNNNPISNISVLTAENLPNLQYVDLSNTRIGNVYSLKDLLTRENAWYTINLSNNKGISGYEQLINETVVPLEINLSGCGLTTIPNIKERKYLQSILMADNNISSGVENIPEECMAIDLSNNNLSDISGLENHRVNYLKVANNNLTTLPSLTYTYSIVLDISQNPITDYSFLEKIIKVNPTEELEEEYEFFDDYDVYGDYDSDYISLTIDNSNLTDLSGLNVIKQRSVDLSLKNNNITDLSTLSEELRNKLYGIDLSGNKNLSGLSALSNVEVLVLKDCDLTDISDITNLENITTLDLSNNKIKEISGLSNLKGLQSLSLSGNVGIEGTLNIRNLSVLNLDGCDIDNTFNLLNLPDLYLINLKNNPRFTEISNLVSSVSSSFLQLYIDRIDFNDYEKIKNNTEKYIYILGAKIDVNEEMENGQVDFSNIETLKKFLMTHLSDRRLIIENGQMTKKGFIVNVLDQTNPSLTIYINDNYDKENISVYNVLLNQTGAPAPEETTTPEETTSASPSAVTAAPSRAPVVQPSTPVNTTEEPSGETEAPVTTPDVTPTPSEDTTPSENPPATPPATTEEP